MAVARPKGALKALPLDPRKESVIRELSRLVEMHGVIVRREKLKQGPGWKVSSGTCRAGEKNFIFVDRRMPQEEQLSFLLYKARIMGLDTAAIERSLHAAPTTVETAR